MDVINFIAKVQADLDHGQPRSDSRFGDDGQFRFESATLFPTILPLHRGWPYLDQGDEIGMANAGFTTGTPWLAITPNHATINMATDLASGSRSIFEFYRRLIAPRHGSSPCRSAISSCSSRSIRPVTPSPVRSAARP